ncbi:MAG: PepSY-like domain-containing protein [Bacteroidales bacterium]|nr:PepSY-like domain-containing protein [Bacteroidales bacterium]
MIKYILLVIALVAIVSFPIFWADNDKVITFDQLPQNVQVMLNKHLENKVPVIVTTDWDDYKIMYQSGEQFEFDKLGNWRDLDFWLSQVPSELVPEQILSNVKLTFPGTSIVKIERDNRGYDVKLSNGMELEYNSHFQIVDIDD